MVDLGASGKTTPTIAGSSLSHRLQSLEHQRNNSITTSSTDQESISTQQRNIPSNNAAAFSSSSGGPAPTSVIDNEDEADYESYSDTTEEEFLNGSAAATRVNDMYLHGASITSVSTFPSIFTSPPVLRDDLVTSTSTAQDEVVVECLPLLAGMTAAATVSPFIPDSSSSLSSPPPPPFNAHGIPPLNRAGHARFVRKFLAGLPAPYVAADSARPWFLYWCLCALATLDEGRDDRGEDAEVRRRLVATVAPMQSPGGGFVGGGLAVSHVATTYAIVLALAIAGCDGRRRDDGLMHETLGLIDRKAMWEWLGVLKQKNGGFAVAVGGEVDIRGAYCAMVVISLLSLPLNLPIDSPGRVGESDTFLTGLPEYVSRCQTYEGGVAARPDAEAHGAYAFCALGCLSLLGEPQKIIPRYLDVPKLISWLSARQYAPEGGFSGRTNKLVDGCYAHWVGGCFPLIEACLNTQLPKTENDQKASNTNGLFSREGLIRYIMCCCQDSRKGGLRDKPGANPDAYHTCYILAGLSGAQHKWNFKIGPTDDSNSSLIDLEAPYNWYSSKFDGLTEPQVFNESDRVRPLNPVFVIPEGTAEAARKYFTDKSFD